MDDISNPNGVVPIKYPAYMTGSLLREKLGMPDKPKKGFRCKGKFKRIPKHKRLGYLKAKVRDYERTLTAFEINQHRSGFNSHKFKSLPIGETSDCYCCSHKAEIRHHVVPLASGGRNKQNNIVLLCKKCHSKVHPHLHRKKKVSGSFTALRSADQINGPIVVSREIAVKAMQVSA